MFLTGRGTLASCPHQEETTWSGPLAGKLAPEYPEWSGCQSQQRRIPARVAICCRKADPFQGLKLGSCLTLRNELSEETHVLTKQEILLGKGTLVESSRVREPRFPRVLPGKFHERRSLVGRKEWDTTSLSLLTFMLWRRKWQPTPMFLSGESQGRGSLVGCRLWGHTESDRTETT